MDFTLQSRTRKTENYVLCEISGLQYITKVMIFLNVDFLKRLILNALIESKEEIDQPVCACNTQNFSSKVIRPLQL